MQVRACGLSRSADAADARSSLNPLPDADPNAREVRIHRPHVIPVLDRHQIAVSA
jgi:hypothetical protein